MSIESSDRSEIRKLQVTGGSTYIVSLPRKWVTEHGLSAKDRIKIEWRPSGSLRLNAETTNVRKRRKIEINIDEINYLRWIAKDSIRKISHNATANQTEDDLNRPSFHLKVFSKCVNGKQRNPGKSCKNFGEIGKHAPSCPRVCNIGEFQKRWFSLDQIKNFNGITPELLRVLNNPRLACLIKNQHRGKKNPKSQVIHFIA